MFEYIMCWLRASSSGKASQRPTGILLVYRPKCIMSIYMYIYICVCVCVHVYICDMRT